MKEKKIIFFDGTCNLCNGFIDFIMSRDKKRVFYFASLQGKSASEELSQDYTDNLFTVVLKDGAQVYTKSTAALRVLKDLGPPLSLLFYIFIMFPEILRNAIYNLIAKNRYKIFGKKDTCRLPTEEEKEYFLL